MKILCYIWQVMGLSTDEVIEFFSIYLILASPPWPWAFTELLIEMSTRRYFWGVEHGLCVRLAT
jgi:hypothetical protein